MHPWAQAHPEQAESPPEQDIHHQSESPDPQQCLGLREWSYQQVCC